MMEKVIEKTAMQLDIENFSVVQPAMQVHIKVMRPVIWNCYQNSYFSGIFGWSSVLLINISYLATSCLD